MYRTTFIDPDYRRDTKTSNYCIRCQRDLKPGQPYRFMAYELDQAEAAIHSEDWEIAREEIVARRSNVKHLETFCVSPIGMDCAKKIGMEFTRETK